MGRRRKRLRVVTLGVLLTALLGLMVVIAIGGCTSAQQTREQMELQRQHWKQVADTTQQLGGEAELVGNVRTQATGLIEGIQLPIDANATMMARIDVVKARLFDVVLAELEFQREVIRRLLPVEVPAQQPAADVPDMNESFGGATSP